MSSLFARHLGRTAILKPFDARRVLDYDFRLGARNDIASASRRGLRYHSTPTITFTRGSSGTYFDSAGVLQTAGSNVARFDHNPVSGAPLGLLVEEQRENLCLQSEDMGTTWDNSWGGGLTLATNQAVAPDGTTTADQITQDDGLDDGLFQNITLASASTYTWSQFWKNIDSPQSRMHMWNATDGEYASLNFDWTAGVPSTNSSTGASNITYENIGDGWHRISFNFSPTTDAIANRPVFFPNSGTVDTLGTYVWGVDIQVGSFPTSYIKTTTAAVTRSADVATIALSDVPGFSTTEGTVYAEYQVSQVAVSAATVWSISDNSISDQIYQQLLTNDPQFNIYNGAFQAQLNDSNAATADTAIKTASAWKLNDVAVVTNGGTPLTDTSADMPVGLSDLDLGKRWNDSEPLNGHIARLVYWNTRQSDAFLQAITS